MAAQENITPVESACDAVLKKLTWVMNIVLFVVMLTMGLVLGANIVLRYVFESPIRWSNVVTRYAYIYIVFLGTAVSYIEGGHAQIDFVHDMAPKWMKGVFDFLHVACMMFLCVIMTIYGIKHVMTMWGVHSPAVPSLSIGVVYLSVPISAVVIFVFLVTKLITIKIR